MIDGVNVHFEVKKLVWDGTDALCPPNGNGCGYCV